MLKFLFITALLIVLVSCQMRWEELQKNVDIPIDRVNNTMPIGRVGHSLNCLKSRRENSTLIMFGGFDGRKTMNDLWKFNTRNNTWVKVNVTGTQPPPRAGHFSCVMGDRMLIFGGMRGINSSHNLKDLYLYDSRENRYRKLRDSPIVITNITGACIERPRRMMIVGGYRQEARVPTVNGIVEKNGERERRRDEERERERDRERRREEEPGREGERGREEERDRERMSENAVLLKYDIENDRWEEMRVRGLRDMEMRIGAKSARTRDDSKILCFGGLYLENDTLTNDISVLDLRRNRTYMESTRDPAPKGRIGHSFTLVDGVHATFGGYDGERLLNDLWQYDERRNRWREIRAEGKKPNGRAFHAATRADDYLYVVGGAQSMDKFLNDVWRVRIRE